MTKSTLTTLLLLTVGLVSFSQPNFDKEKLDSYFKVLEENNKFMGSVAISKNGKVMGTYLHGLFSADDFRESFFSKLSNRDLHSTTSYQQNVNRVLDDFVDVLEQSLDVESILSLAR